MGLSVSKGKAKAAAEKPAAVNENDKVKAAAEGQVPVTNDVDNDIIGSKSDTLIFLNPLEDPSQPDTTEVTVNGEKQQLTTGTIVGYRFMSTEPISIPDCGCNIDFKKDRMNYVNAEGTRQVAANEPFDLTPFEMAMLLSRPEYNVVASGGDYPVKCTYNFSGSKTKDGTVLKNNKTPRASLRGIKTSVKQIPMIKVLEFTSKKNENGTTTIDRKINAGFEKWEPLCQKVTNAGRGAGAGAANKKVYSGQAQTFLSLIKAKK